MTQVEISRHARERMSKYQISEESVKVTVQKPDSITEGYGGRMIYQKRINQHILRAIVEDYKGSKRVITVYRAEARRYTL